MPIIDQKFGRLLVIEKDLTREYHVICLCDCGTKKSIAKHNLISGSTKSCGCLSRERLTKHGDCGTRFYSKFSLII